MAALGEHGGIPATSYETFIVTFVTDFADQAVILPLIVAVALSFGLHQHWRVGAAWIAATGGVLGVTLVLKLAGYGCGVLVAGCPLERVALISPSGHVASAAIGYGGLFACLAPASQGRTAPSARWSFLAGLGFASLIGVTRVALREHSLAEVMLGAVIGVLGAVAFGALARRHVGNVSGVRLIGVVLPVILICHGFHFSLESAIRAVSVRAVHDLLAVADASDASRFP